MFKFYINYKGPADISNESYLSLWNNSMELPELNIDATS